MTLGLALPLAALTAPTIVFGIIALVAVIGALVVVLHRNPVVCAMGLVTNLLCIAGIYVLLNAHFFAALQVIIYAGAIVVLITFVIMLLNLQPESRSGPGLVAFGGALLLGAGLVVLLARAGLSFDVPEAAGATLAEGFGSVTQMGDAVFRVYWYPLLMVTLALLAAMAGAVLLAKRQLED